MKLQLWLGPPASGRTAAMVAIAREACRAGRRVWWIGLPAQRPGVFRRITEGGFTALGLEVMSSQQMYYRLLAGPSFVEAKPLVVGTARLVRVAEALAECAGSLPAPGEAKLFAAAIAEVKRFGLGHDDIVAAAHDDVEVARLAEVFSAYQGAMADRWDYDDVRAQAQALVATKRFEAFAADEAEWARAGLPDLVVVDGLRELGPLDLHTLTALGTTVDTHLTLPLFPTGLDSGSVKVVELAARPSGAVFCYQAPNVVSEARFALRSLKRDLAEGGYDPLDLAVIAPAGTATALVALGDEYGLPLVDESPRTMADTPEGRTLLDLLELPEMPTASRLLAIPELAPLAAEALRLGVAGADALTRVARSLGLESSWRGWSRRLRVGGEPVEWTRSLLTDVLRLTHPELSHGFESRVMNMAQEAASLAGGEAFAVWLAALLRDTHVGVHSPGGIALLDAKLVSGRRFKKVYLLGAVEGGYSAAEREDYFLSEDARSPAVAAEKLESQLPGTLRLPRRFQGRDDVVVAELLSRADETVVIAPETGAEGPSAPDRRLLGDDAAALPLIPAGSVLELGGPPPYVAEFDPVGFERFGLGLPGAEFLRRYEQCAFRAWGEWVLLRSDREYDQLEPESQPEPVRLESATVVDRPADRPDDRPNDRPDDRPDDWYLLVGALRACRTLTRERLGELGARFPDFREWLERHAEHLTRLTWGTELRAATGIMAFVHAGERLPLGSRGRAKSVIYRFVEPVPDADWAWARDKQRDRWNEYLAAQILLGHRTQAPSLVEVTLWPLLGEPIRVDTTTSDFVANRLNSVSVRAAAAKQRLGRGDATPTPGFHCRDCALFEVCRVGQRS